MVYRKWNRRLVVSAGVRLLVQAVVDWGLRSWVGQFAASFVSDTFEDLSPTIGVFGVQGGNVKFRRGRKNRSIPNAHVRSEIKDRKQIRKEREKKANRTAHLKSKSSKGKKFKRSSKKGKAK